MHQKIYDIYQFCSKFSKILKLLFILYRQLMRVLDDQRQDRTVLSWLDDGKSFEIRNVREFERDILPESFDFDPSFRLFQRKVRVS